MNAIYQTETIKSINKNIIFKNSFGTIYQKKIKIAYNNYETEVYISDLAYFRMIKKKDTRINIILFIIACSFFTVTFILDINNLNGLICYGSSLVFLLLSMFYSKMTYSVQLVLDIAKQIIININKKDKQIASIFIKKLEEYKKSDLSK